MEQHPDLRKRKAPRLGLIDYPSHSKKGGIFQDISSNSLSYNSKTWLIILLFYLGLFTIVYYCDVVRIPRPVLMSDFDGSVPRSSFFSEERARNFLNELSSIGSKPTGSYENEVLAVNYFKQLLTNMKSSTKSHNEFQFDIQRVTGCFPLSILDGMSSCYMNIKNIVVKIGPRNSTKRSLLVNCHFDSVPTSPGASDDLASCAVMLETLLALSSSSEPLHYPVIFLFNGAEENILQAAHGFITKHKWAKDIAAFINMEACGSGGKQMLFQASHKETWLLESYARSASYPYGSVIAQDIFTSGLIPSDTDYRIFEKFGNLPGLDFAYVKNGYIYHTKFDSPEFIDHGSLQQSGDNLLRLIHDALKSPGMEDKNAVPPKQYVFFDFLGIFMVWYTKNTASIINLCAIIPILAEFLIFIDPNHKLSLISKIKLVFKALFFIILTLLAAIVVNISISLVLHLSGSTMSWYRNPFLIAGLYGCPSLAAIISILGYKKRNKEKVSASDQLNHTVYLAAGKFLWLFILIVMQLTGLNSFICTAWIYVPTLLRFACAKVNQLSGLKVTETVYLVQYLFIQTIPLLLLMYCMWSLYTVFIPIMGRIGTLLNPDILIGLLTAIFVFVATMYMMSLIQLTHSVKYILMLLAVIFAITFFLVSCTSAGFQYSGNPQSPAMMRCYVLHTKRTFWNKTEGILNDSGYWVAPLDFNGPKLLHSYIPGMKSSHIVDCESNLACGMPFYMPVLSLLRKTYFVPAEPPKIHGSKKFALIAKKHYGSDLLSLVFRITGPDHMTLILSPQKGIKLEEWSLYAGTPLPGLPWNGRKTYFIYYSHGEFTVPWEITLTFKVPRNFSDKETVVDLLFATHHLHGHDSVSDQFRSMLNTIPEWIHITPWSSTLDIFTF